VAKLATQILSCLKVKQHESIVKTGSYLPKSSQKERVSVLIILTHSVYY